MPFCAYCGNQVGEVSYRPCPGCGRATNGAPKPAPADAGTKAIIIIVAVVIGGLVVIAIIGILAAIAIPNLINAKEHANQKRTVVDMRVISTELARYRASHDTYPQDLSALDVPRVDGWKHPLRYECRQVATPCDAYILASPGKDGIFQHDDLREYQSGTTSDFDCDLVFANDSFLQYPEGIAP